VALPIYLVIQKFTSAIECFAIIVATSIILKFTWYDHLKREEELRSAEARKETLVSAGSAT
jgi:uncharacterized protein (DUF486 family)